MTQPGETSATRSPTIFAPSNVTSRGASSIGDRQSSARFARSGQTLPRTRRGTVTIDIPELQKLGYRVVLDNLLEEHGVIRHNPGAWLAYFSRNSCLASIMRAIKFALPDPCNAGSKRFFVFFASPSRQWNRILTQKVT